VYTLRIGEREQRERLPLYYSAFGEGRRSLLEDREEEEQGREREREREKSCLCVAYASGSKKKRRSSGQRRACNSLYTERITHMKYTQQST
jgi:hypothetical protein